MWEKHSIETAYDRREAEVFLQGFGLQYDYDSDVTVLVRQGDSILGTGSLKGNVLQCFAIREDRQGEGISARLVDHLADAAYQRGQTRLFVFTTPANAPLFKEMGFRPLAQTPWAALLETGFPSIADYLSDLQSKKSPLAKAAAGLVMNCNPFTLGHQYLVEKASAAIEHVYLLVVEEDRSVFPFEARFDLVVQGTSHLKNVTVLPTGPYAVSLATFPSYFSAEETAHARAGASVDATLYASLIAPALGISKRFVGTEPYSPVTAIYNDTMKEVLAHHGIELVEIPRLEIAGSAVSASLVRKALREDDLPALTQLLPNSTLRFLQSEKATGIIQRVKQRAGRH